MTAVDQQLAETLDLLASLTSDLRDPWWIIGSTAAILVGAPDEAADVDLLTSAADARRLLKGRNLEAPIPSTLFRSAVFGRLSIAPLPIEVMAELEVRGEPLVPRTRVERGWRGRVLHVPSIEEQIEILRFFGRAKDLHRAERLTRLLQDQRGSL